MIIMATDNTKETPMQRWRRTHKEQWNEYCRMYHSKHKDKRNEKTRKTYEKYKDKYKEKMRARYAKNKDKVLEYEREYYKQHKKEILNRVKAYSKTIKGKETGQKHRATRHRELQYYPLNQSFVGSTGHHIDTKNVIHIPENIHTSIGHRQNNNKSMLKINLKAWDYLEMSVL